MKRPLAVLLILACIPLCAEAQGFQTGRLPATSRDSFEVMYQGQAIGAFILSLNRTGDNFVLVGDARLPRMSVSELDSVVFNGSTGAPVSMVNISSMQGVGGVSRTTVTNGKATGTAQRPGPGGLQTVNIDATIGAGVLADGVEVALLSTIDISDGLTLNFQTFDAKAGTTKSNTLKILGKETVTVPAGTAECWRVEMTSDETVEFLVSAAEPRRIMLIRFAAAGLEMRRAK
jgi:hypothetical protein